MGYLDAYGEGVDRRNRIIKILLLSLLVLLILATILYFRFRNYREERAVDGFFEALKARDYPTAYTYWGCSVAKPCRDYSFEKFQEDWGPKSPHTDLASLQFTNTKSCQGGVIKFVKIGNDEVQLWIGRRDRVIGFAPWPVCNPRMQVDASAK